MNEPTYIFHKGFLVELGPEQNEVFGRMDVDGLITFQGNAYGEVLDLIVRRLRAHAEAVRFGPWAEPIPHPDWEWSVTRPNALCYNNMGLTIWVSDGNLEFDADIPLLDFLVPLEIVDFLRNL